MSVATTSANRASLVKPLAWTGIFGAAVLIVIAVVELASPPQVGNKIVNPVLFQIVSLLEILGFAGWVLICLAFYQSAAACKIVGAG